jgi:hypothetical protein
MNKPVLVKGDDANIFSGDALIAIDHQNMIGTKFDFWNCKYDHTVPVIDWAALISDLKRYFCPVAALVSFADWSKNTVYQNDLARAGVEMVSAPDYPKKNVDFVMTAETSIRVGKRASIRRVILLTHDGDYARLTECLQANGCTVIVVGVSKMSISKDLFQICDAAFKIDMPMPEANHYAGLAYA